MRFLIAFLSNLALNKRAALRRTGLTDLERIKANLPGAEIVYDRFHLMMNLNQAVDQVRREASEQDRSLIKGSRFLPLAHAENLSDTGEQKLQELLRVNEGLSMAYQLKEQFKGIFQYKKQGWAPASLGSMVCHGEGERSPTIPTFGEGIDETKGKSLWLRKTPPDIRQD